MELTTGIKGHRTEVVTEDKTAAARGSGALEVYGTPSMVAFMEETARKSVEAGLAPGLTTVGTALNIQHLAATPVGLTVTCESELIEIDRKRLVFKLTVSDKDGLIGSGTHERFIVDSEKFLTKTNAKKS